jgi:hypothetical protein
MRERRLHAGERWRPHAAASAAAAAHRCDYEILRLTAAAARRPELPAPRSRPCSAVGAP